MPALDLHCSFNDACLGAGGKNEAVEECLLELQKALTEANGCVLPLAHASHNTDALLLSILRFQDSYLDTRAEKLL